MTDHRQVWIAIQQGNLSQAVLLTRDLLAPEILEDTARLPGDWPICAAYAVAASNGSRNLRGFADLAQAIALPNDKSRALHTMRTLKDAIRQQDWYSANRMCARIRFAMPGASLSHRITFQFLVSEPEAWIGDTAQIDRYFGDLDTLIAR
jgi:hypothetical protein